MPVLYSTARFKDIHDGIRRHAIFAGERSTLSVDGVASAGRLKTKELIEIYHIVAIRVQDMRDALYRGQKL